jgi:hypothetical protein
MALAKGIFTGPSITVNWQLVAEVMVNDLITQEAFSAIGWPDFEAQRNLATAKRSFVPYGTSP